MSVLIKGMDKETAMRLCSYAGIWMEEEDFIERPPHGRLIDADELLKRKGDAYDSRGHLLYAVGTGSIVTAPTIIEAEE